MRQLYTQNDDYDITSQINVLTGIPDVSVPTLCQGLLILGDGVDDLSGDGGDYEITVNIGSQVLEPDPQTIAFSTGLRSSLFTSAFPVPANTEVQIGIKSPNASDSGVDITSYLYEVSALQPVVLGRQLAVESDNTIASSVTGIVDANIVQVSGQDVSLATDFEADLTKIHGTDLTETAGQLAGRFTDFFDQAAAAYNVNTALTAFQAEVSDIPTNSEFEARTLASGDYFNALENSVNVTGVVDANLVQITGVTSTVDNFGNTYDGVGYNNDYAPAQQQQLDKLAIGSAGISVVADTGTVLVGNIEAGTYENTKYRDSSYHQVSDDGGTTEIDYEFSIGGNGIPASITLYGHMEGSNDNINVYGYNWGNSDWDQVGILEGTRSSTDTENTYSLYSSHVGTGPDIGSVKVKISGDGLSSSDLYIDQLYTSYAVVAQSVGYANGAIWVNTNASNTNSTIYVDGVADNPVSTWTAALSLSSQLGIKRFEIINGSTIQLSGNSDNYSLLGHEWTLDLNGQSVAGMLVQNANIYGSSTGGSYRFITSKIALLDSISVQPGGMKDCAIGASGIILNSAGTYLMDGCFSAVAGVGTPYIDFEDAAEDKNLNMRHYSGGVKFMNLGQYSSTDKVSIEGHGQFIIDSSCDPSSHPTIASRGHFTITDNVAGGFVAGGGILSDDARFDVAQISGEVTHALDGYDILTNSELESRTIPSGDYFSPADDVVAHVTLVDTVTNLTNNTDLSDVNTKLDTIATDVSGVPTNAEFESRTLPSGDYFDTANDVVTVDGTVDANLVSVTGSQGTANGLGNVGDWLPSMIESV